MKQSIPKFNEYWPEFYTSNGRQASQQQTVRQIQQGMYEILINLLEDVNQKELIYKYNYYI